MFFVKLCRRCWFELSMVLLRCLVVSDISSNILPFFCLSSKVTMSERWRASIQCQAYPPKTTASLSSTNSKSLCSSLRMSLGCIFSCTTCYYSFDCAIIGSFSFDDFSTFTSLSSQCFSLSKWVMKNSRAPAPKYGRYLLCTLFNLFYVREGSHGKWSSWPFQLSYVRDCPCDHHCTDVTTCPHIIVLDISEI